MATSDPAFCKLARVTWYEQYTMGIPVYVALGDAEQVDLRQFKDETIALVQTGNGLYVYKNNGIFRTFLKSDEGIAGLAEVKPSVNFQLEPMSKDDVDAVIGFFDWAYKEFYSEAVVLLFYDYEKAKKDEYPWYIFVPEQDVNGAHAGYDVIVATQQMKESHPGYIRVGSWHSHASGEAYHSSVDTGDEHFDDGVHLTAGNFTSSKQVLAKPSIVATLALDGRRWPLDPDEILGYEVELKESKGYKQGADRWVEGKKKFWLKPADNEDLIFPEEWKKKVTAKKAVTYSGTGSESWRNHRNPCGNAANIAGGSDINSWVKCRSCQFCCTKYEIEQALEAGGLILSNPGIKKALMAKAAYVHQKSIELRDISKNSDEFEKLFKELLTGISSYSPTTYITSWPAAWVIIRTVKIARYRIVLENLSKSDSFSKAFNGDYFCTAVGGDKCGEEVGPERIAAPCRKYGPRVYGSYLTLDSNVAHQYGKKMKDYEDDCRLAKKGQIRVGETVDNGPVMCGDCKVFLQVLHDNFEGVEASEFCKKNSNKEGGTVRPYFISTNARQCPDFEVSDTSSHSQGPLDVDMCGNCEHYLTVFDVNSGCPTLSPKLGMTRDEQSAYLNTHMYDDTCANFSPDPDSFFGQGG